MSGFLRRLGQSALALLRAVDILLATVWLSLLYPFGLADKPSGRQMISSYIGWAEANSHRWAIIAGWLIDRAAMVLGDRPGHCLRAYRHYKGLDGA